MGSLTLGGNFLDQGLRKVKRGHTGLETLSSTDEDMIQAG